MKLPKPIIEHLKKSNIHKPTPIQVSGVAFPLAIDSVRLSFTTARDLQSLRCRGSASIPRFRDFRLCCPAAI
jgi:hypothetical protein